MVQAGKRYLRALFGEVWVVLGGAIFTILGFVQSRVPSWGWFAFAALLFLYANQRVYGRMDKRLSAALRDPREIAEIRLMLRERLAAGVQILDGLKADLGAIYAEGKIEMFLGTRGTNVHDWRTGTREEVKRLLPGRVVEFDAMESTAPQSYADRNRIRRGADDYDALRSRLEAELEWLEEMRVLAGMAGIWGATTPKQLDP